MAYVDYHPNVFLEGLIKSRKTPTVIVALLQDQQSNPGQFDGTEGFLKRSHMTNRRQERTKIEHQRHSKFVLLTPCEANEACGSRYNTYPEQKTELHYRLRRVSYRTITVCCNV